MNDKPINMTSDSVRKILAKLKRHTRRALKDQPLDNHWKGLEGYELKVSQPHESGDGSWYIRYWHKTDEHGCTEATVIKCPYVVGQHLWVREDYASIPAWDSTKPSDIPEGVTRHYYADHGDLINTAGWGKKRSGMFMPRKFSRITLEIVSIKVERVQDISEADCIAEGIAVFLLQSMDDPSAWYQSAPGVHQARSAVSSYALLWDEINGKKPGRNWQSNPWCWCVEFRMVEKG